MFTFDADIEVGNLLKQATQESKVDINLAITTLKKAYLLMEKSTVIHVTETYLRLPLYLQKANRYAESIPEFQFLLKRAWAANVNEPLWGGASIIYDKMRVSAHREKHYNDAVRYGVLSHAAECLHQLNKAQCTKAEMAVSYAGLESIQEMRNARLKKQLAENMTWLNECLMPSTWDKVICGLLGKYPKLTIMQSKKDLLLDAANQFAKCNTLSALEQLDIELQQIFSN